MSMPGERSVPDEGTVAAGDGRPKFVDAPKRRRLPSMLITSDFLFIHVPRTGGRFLRRLCEEYLPPERMIRNALSPHTEYHVVADDFADLPMIAFVRNPWDWYVSWYHYLMQTTPERRRGPMWETALAGGGNTFRRAVTMACTGEGLEDVYTRETMRQRGIDHYSAAYWRRAGVGAEEGRVEIGHYERLGEDFLAFLERHNVPVPDGLSKALNTEPPVGATRRDEYRAYYDDELRDLVAEKARGLIADHGYSFE
jgi:hypothetical protein